MIHTTLIVACNEIIRTGFVVAAIVLVFTIYSVRCVSTALAISTVSSVENDGRAWVGGKVRESKSLHARANVPENKCPLPQTIIRM